MYEMREPLEKAGLNTSTDTHVADPSQWHVGLVGYGEVGRILAEDLRAGSAVSAFDLKLGGDARPAAARACSEHRASRSRRRTPTLAGAGWTSWSRPSPRARPWRSPTRARRAASRRFFLDFNSASPSAEEPRRRTDRRRGGRYVEGAVMTSVPPYRIKVPLLLGGRQRRRAAPLLEHARLRRQGRERRARRRHGTKMCRSVMIKGLEAMVIESFTAARAYGVEDAVIASLARPSRASTGRSRAPTSSSASSSTAAGAARRCARSPTPCARPALRPGRRRHRRTPGLGRRPRRPGSVRTKGDAGFARSPDWRIEADRILAAAEEDGRSAGHAIPEDARLARLVRPTRQPAVQAAARRGRRALPRVRPGRGVSRSRPSASTRRATPARRSCSRCATTSASRATSSCRRPATAPTTARWSTRCMHSRRQGARRRHRAAQRHRRRAAGRCTRPACAACASTSSSASSTSRRRTS